MRWCQQKLARRFKTGLSPNICARAADRDHQGDFSPLSVTRAMIMLPGDKRRAAVYSYANRPLSAILNMPPLQVEGNFIPPPLREYGASGGAPATRAFNHVAAGVKQLADDRTLVDGGRSATTLRTPLFDPYSFGDGDDGRGRRLSRGVDQ